MKIKVFNDTKEDWLIHYGSVFGSNGECRIPAHQFVEFEGPDNSELFLKVWEAIEKPKHQSPVVMVRFTEREVNAIKHPFAGAQSALFGAKWKAPFAPRLPPNVDYETGLSRL